MRLFTVSLLVVRKRLSGENRFFSANLYTAQTQWNRRQFNETQRKENTNCCEPYEILRNFVTYNATK